MQQEDWFMRQINLLARVFGKLIADLLRLKTQGRVSEGIEEAEQTFNNELDLDLDTLISLPEDQLIRTLLEERRAGDDILEMLADFFSLLAKGYEERGTEPDKKRRLLERALALYTYLENSGSTYSIDRRSKIERIKSALSFQR